MKARRLERFGGALTLEACRCRSRPRGPSWCASKSEPRSSSPVIGRSPTSFWQTRRIWSRFIDKHEFSLATHVNRSH